ncbi:sugar phosphate isomerase/epimerase family protein [Desulfobacter curvatus]|uniref:sugar phosphate isomerase/epimerase family protein n=1 Tax=Desulfobacter curvatus TaxID=2290 RepID=UPI00037338CD|nr:sugar phosphate isomerase/epimerase family protein [Desulfobacter curvatus]
MFKLGYNTNGFANHSLLSAIDIIGGLGYESIAVTIDHYALNPWNKNFETQLVRVKAQLEKYALASVVETGARFLLNPQTKHEPTLISPGKNKRETRIKFIEKCLEVASFLGSDAVSIWSGQKKDGVSDQNAWEWLISGCRKLSEKAEDFGIYIAFEPEPGMFVENLDQYDRLKEKINHDLFKLTLDLGHALITEKSISKAIWDYRNDIVNIHLEDMKKDKHDHLFFGEGEMDFQKIFRSLKDINYSGQVNIELSRHSHNAVETAKKAKRFLRGILPDPKQSGKIPLI